MNEEGKQATRTFGAQTAQETNTTAQTGWNVLIVLKRVQTFLFASPQLRDMVGANVLVGETMRSTLYRRAVECGCLPLGKIPPEIAFDHSEDPLEKADVKDKDLDRPDELLAQGIINRDGGRFNALFAKEKDATEFMRIAQTLLASDLPDLIYTINRCRFPRSAKNQETADKKGPKPDPCLAPPKDPKPDPCVAPPKQSKVISDLPVFRVCQASGNGVATDHDRSRKEWISNGILLRRDARERFVEKKSRTCDMIGLLRDRLPLQGLEPAEDFKNLCGEGGYLAVIHADGNSIGQRVRDWQKPEKCQFEKDTLVYEAHTERLFHSMRRAMRCALITALDMTFTKKYEGLIEKEAIKHRPYQILMLGGDDLLLVCRADDALPLVARLCAELANDKNYLADGSPLGIGVAIAKPTFPFHRLHATAESLASSAKRLYRQREKLKEPPLSVIDWHVVTASWTDDPLAERRRTALIEQSGETLALSCKPYPVVGDKNQDGTLTTLSGLLEKADALRESGAARNQWRQLAIDLRRGRLWAELHLRELPPQTRDAFASAGNDQPWMEVQLDSKNQQERRYWKTHLPDLIELVEMPLLGRQTKANQTNDAQQAAQAN